MNLQNIPRSDRVVKAAFVPKLDAFVFADYPQIELKVLGYVLEHIGFPSMADVFRAGGDIYRETAAGVFQKPVSQVTDAERQIGKRLDLSVVYGGGMPTVMRQLGISAKEALDLLRAFHKTWPGIGWATKRKDPDEGTLSWWLSKRIAERTTPTQKGYITTLYGRHLHPHSAHVQINCYCQGTAADLKKWAMIQCYQGLQAGGYVSHLVNEVHDELIFDVAADEVADVCRLIPDWMTDPRIESIVPIKPSCEVSWTTWAEKEEYEQPQQSCARSA